MLMPSEDRFARCCTDAFFGYARAASETYWSMTHETLRFWTDATDAVSRSASRTSSAGVESWYRPERPVRSALLPSAVTPHSAWGIPRYEPFAPFRGATPALPSPLAVWFNMFPLRGSPTAWPMAFAMMSAGVPRTIAWPAAEANAAMIDAAGAAKETFESVLAASRPRARAPYHMGRSPTTLMSAMWTMPFAALPLANWPLG
jgi:hypothetical protein